MATPTFQLDPPPAVKDPRWDQWAYILWKYIREATGTGNSVDIIADAVFAPRRDWNTGTAQASDVAEKQQILANQIFGG